MNIDKVIFGGSFNPPTKAHYQITKDVIKKYNVKDFIFLPTANFYNKSDLIDVKYRFDMLNLVCNQIKEELNINISVSLYEANDKEYKGTYNTLNHYKGYYFLMGADNLNEITTWKNFPNLIIDNKFIVIDRGEFNINSILSSNEYLNKYRDNFIIYKDYKKIDVSSSLYRKNHDSNLLLDSINEYITTNKLY